MTARVLTTEEINEQAHEIFNALKDVTHNKDVNAVVIACALVLKAIAFQNECGECPRVPGDMGSEITMENLLRLLTHVVFDDELRVTREGTH